MWCKRASLIVRTYAGEFRATVILGLVGVIVVVLVPFTSDVYRVWMRQADLVEGGLYTVGQFEYPPLGSTYLHALSGLPTPGFAVMVNGLVMVVAALAITWVIADNSPGNHRSSLRLWAFSPALVFLLPLAFDVAAALMALLAVAAMSVDRVSKAGVFIGTGTLIKFFPAALALPLLPLIRDRKKRKLFLVSGAVSLLVGYAVYAVFYPGTWLLHFQFAASRQDSWTTLWRFVDPLLGTNETANLIISVGSAVGLVAALVAIGLWAAKRQPPVVVVAVLALIAFLLLNKVFKPQHILWVTPLYAYAGGKKLWMRLLEYSAITELFTYYLPLPQEVYVVSLIARSVALIAMLGIVRHPSSKQEPKKAEPAMPASAARHHRRGTDLPFSASQMRGESPPTPRP